MAVVTVKREHFIIAGGLNEQCCCGESHQPCSHIWALRPQQGYLVAQGVDRSPEPSLLRASGRWGTVCPERGLQRTEDAEVRCLCQAPFELWASFDGPRRHVLPGEPRALCLHIHGGTWPRFWGTWPYFRLIAATPRKH